MAMQYVSNSNILQCFPLSFSELQCKCDNSFFEINISVNKILVVHSLHRCFSLHYIVFGHNGTFGFQFKDFYNNRSRYPECKQSKAKL